MNPQAEAAIIRARTQLLLEQPFFGTLALRLRVVEDPSIKTLCVDGRTMFYNPDYVLQLDRDYHITAVAHEVGHCMLDHMGRLDGRQHKRWNRACDFALNPILDEAGLPLHPSWLHNPQFAGKSADEIYSLLPPDEDGGGEDGQDDMKHDMSDAERQEIAADWQIAVGQAAKIAADAGKLPGSLERFLTDYRKASVDWRAVLRTFVGQITRNDFSWMRPNRMMMAYGVIIPGLYSESMGTCVVVSDDSGSVNNEILNALAGEIDAIAAVAEPEKLIHISCDCEVNHVAEFAQGEEFKMVSKGGGGTDFHPPFKYVEREGITPSCLIYLTDGYGPFPQNPPPYPVLWAMTTDVVPPWGEYVQIEV